MFSPDILIGRKMIPIITLLAVALAACAPIHASLKVGDIATAKNNLTLYYPDYDPSAGLPGHESSQKCTVKTGDQVYIDSIQDGWIRVIDKTKPDIPNRMSCAGITLFNSELLNSLKTSSNKH